MSKSDTPIIILKIGEGIYKANFSLEGVKRVRMEKGSVGTLGGAPCFLWTCEASPTLDPRARRHSDALGVCLSEICYRHRYVKNGCPAYRL